MDLQQVVQKLSCFDCDAGGTLYGVCQSGSDPPTIITVDARHDILARSSSSGSSSTLQGSTKSSIDLGVLHVSTVVKTVTAIDFVVKSICASRNGHYLLLTGHQGEEYAAVAVIDVYGGRHVSSSSGPAATFAAPSTPTAGSYGGYTPLRSKRGPAASAAVAAGGVRYKECSVHHLDPQLYQSRPGLIVYQASWHPHSDSHLAVLTSDSKWRLYSLKDLSLPEQTFDLRACLTEPLGSGTSSALARQTPGSPLLSPGPSRFGIIDGAEQLLGVTAFAFGPPVSWGYFTVHFLAGGGAVYAVCPVCPFGMRVPASVLKTVLGSTSGEGHAASSGAGPAAATWLRAAFGASLFDQGVDSKQRWTALRHVHDGASPCLQGPLNAGAASAAADPPSPAVALHSSYLAIENLNDNVAGLSPVSCTSCVVTGLSDGRLFAHACHGLLEPCWADQPPQCVVDVRGDVRATRYNCSIAPLPPPPASSPVGAVCGALLLLDMLDLQLPAVSSQLPSSPGLGADSDDEDAQGAEGPGGVLGFDAGLRRLSLLGSHENPHTLWACHESGSWAITVAWLPTLSQALGEGEEEGEGGSASGQSRSADASLDLTLGLGRLQLAVETVPPPAVKELIQLPASGQGGPWLAAAAVLPDLFLGDSLLVLKMPGLLAAAQTPGPGPAASSVPQGPAMCCFLLRSVTMPAAGGPGDAGSDAAEADARPEAEARSGTAAEAAPSSGTANGTSTTASESPRNRFTSAASSLSTARRELLDANIRAIYNDLIRGWTPLQLPKSTGPTGSQDPEGALHLAQCISLMRQHHVEFLHRADADMRQRTQQLDQEAATHRTALTELQQLLASAQQRQAALLERSHRMLELHHNLTERSEILAQLHWSLPRALSDQEVQLASELRGYEAKSQSLANSWVALRQRADAALADGSSKPHPWATPTGSGQASLPAVQAAKVHSAIMEQFKLISAAMHEVKQLEADASAWKAGHGSEHV